MIESKIETGPYPLTGGRMRRLVDLRNEDAQTAIGWVEDDVHHFGVTVVHRRGVVIDVSASSPRAPYNTCPAAGQSLRELIGAELIERAVHVDRLAHIQEQCTHMFELAGMVMAHAANGSRHRRFEATVDDRPVLSFEPPLRRVMGKGRASILQDGEAFIDWDLDDFTISGPARWAGVHLQDGFRAYLDTLPAEQADAAMVLRRVVFVACSRAFDPAEHRTAGERGISGGCFTYDDSRRHDAIRLLENMRNFQDSSEGMLQHVAERP